MADLYGLEAEPTREKLQLGSEFRRGLRWSALFGEGRVSPQDGGLTIGLEVDPGDQGLVQKERQHVVAVASLVFRGVDLDPVMKAKEALGPGPLEDERIEGGQQCATLDPSWPAGVGVEECSCAERLAMHREQAAAVNQRFDREP